MEISREEFEFRWFDAAKSYEQALSLRSVTGAAAAEYWQRVGFCYGLSSRQAEDADGFRSLRQLGVEAYQKAAKFYEQDRLPENLGKNLECLAIAEHTRSWLESNPVEKRKILGKCLAFGKEALKAFKSVGDELNYGKTLNLLAICAHDLQKITTSSEGKRKVVREGLSKATDAILVLSKFGKDDSLILALGLSCILSTALVELGVQEDERKKLSTRCMNCSKEAIELSEEANNPYSRALAMWAGSLSTYCFEEEIKKRSSLEYPKEMLLQASKVKDKYLQGMAFYLWAYAEIEEVQEEAAPDKKRQSYEEIIKCSGDAVQYLQLVGQDADAAFIWYCCPECYSFLAREFAVSPSEKLAFLKKAVKDGEKGLEYAIRSGSPDALEANLHALSKAHYYSSKLEPRNERKIELLKKALNYRREEIKSTERSFSSNYWYLAVGMVYSAQIEADLARLEENKERKIGLFEDAVAHMESGVSNCKRQLEFGAYPPLITHIAEYEGTFGGMLEEFFFLTGKKETLMKANEVYVDAATNFRKVGLPSSAAESFWKIAGNQDAMGEFRKASNSFENAFAEYKLAARKIRQLNDFYLDYASYMKAWSEIERAKLAHLNEKYGTAKGHYRRASNLLKQSKSWNYIASNFYAWSLFEQAEDLSRKERCQKSIDAFKEALNFLRESKRILRASLDKMDKEDKRKSIERLIEASETREQFSQGRIAMEEAKILDKAGDHSASSEKYESAALIFQNLLRSNPKQIGNEVAMLFYLCQAWQKMTMAEARVSPSMYGEAADLFKLAKEHSSNESASLLALANSNFCKALQAGTEFEVARNMAMYREAGKYMDAAANYYLKAGLRTSSEYAKATQRLFDAHVFMGSGKRESDPEQGAKYYLMAEKVLQLSAESYTKAKHLQKANQVYRLLCKVKEEKELALSLGDILHAPTITSPTSGFATLSLSEEKAVGLERFAHADIQVKLVQHENKIKVGQDVDLEIQIVNVGKEPILLTKIEDIAPVGFQMVDKPDYCSVESTNLIFKGKQLHPLETDEMKIVLRPFMKGSFKIKPRITCVDELGRALFCSPEALTFDVLAVLLAGRITTGYSDLDNLLFGGIPENCSVLLISPSSDERELLIAKFLEAGARSSQITFYITTDMRGVKAFAEYCQLNFFLFVFLPRADAFVESSPNVFRLNGVENLTDIDICLTKVLHRLEPEHNGPRRACIKILSDVLLQHNAVVTQKWLSGLLPELRSKGFTTLAVVNPKMHPTEEVQAIVDQFEGEIEIYEKQTEKGIGQFLRIRKLIGQRYLKNELLLPKE